MSSQQILTSPSSSDEERQLKKMQRNQLLLGVPATATTNYAAHLAHKNRERRRERKKVLAEGEISPEGVKNEGNHARLKDATFVGIAALGVRSAVKEWKETKEKKTRYVNSVRNGRKIMRDDCRGNGA